jgi:DNA-binding NarL/FixJ family response regulator
MDVEMPAMDGITATERLHSILPGCCVIILSLHDDQKTRAMAKAAGAVDFIEKRGGVLPLFTAIRRAAKRDI